MTTVTAVRHNAVFKGLVAWTEKVGTEAASVLKRLYIPTDQITSYTTN